MLKTKGITLCAMVVVCMATVTWAETFHVVAWMELIGSSSSDYSSSVAVDSSDNVYISGNTKDDLDGDTNQGDYDTVLVKHEVVPLPAAVWMAVPLSQVKIDELRPQVSIL